MDIYVFMGMQYTAAKKGKSTINRLNKISEMNKTMKKVYLN